jgi:hypothetical protein
MSRHPSPAPTSSADLETSLAAVESELTSMAEALRLHDWQAIERHAAQLHRALAVAVQRFTQAARSGGVPQALRARLGRAGGQMAAQRDALSRATAALDRAMDILLPAGADAAPQARGRDPDSAVYTPSPM